LVMLVYHKIIQQSALYLSKVAAYSYLIGLTKANH